MEPYGHERFDIHPGQFRAQKGKETAPQITEGRVRVDYVDLTQSEDGSESDGGAAR
jgi:hypothetical protein